MAVPTSKRSQLIRDISRETIALKVAENELRRAMKADPAGANAKQAEAIMTVIDFVEKLTTALTAIDGDMIPLVVGDRSLELKAGDTTITLEQTGSIVLSTGDATIRMLRDGSITLKGKNLRFEGSGDVTIKASKELVLRGHRVVPD